MTPPPVPNTQPTSKPTMPPPPSAANAAAQSPLPPAVLRRRLLAIARPVMAPLGWSILSRIVGLLAGIAMFGLGGWAVGAAAASGGATPPVGQIAVVMVVLALVKGGARYAEQFAGHYVAFKALARIRLFFYDALEPQAPAAIDGRSTGDLLSRLTKDVDRVEVFFAHTLAPAITALLVPLATVGFIGATLGLWPALVLAGGLALVGL
ncbi:MAG: hypothetical protein LBH48_06560, partial [Bifidobacteriaceae bacterium]|nr:hypothetical protein [Bifidobacteriaceae bacterium]